MDVLGWGGFVFGVIGTGTAVLTYATSRRDAAASARSADEAARHAQRMADAAELAAREAQRANDLVASDREANAVRWRVDRIDDSTREVYELVNTGREDAHAVRVEIPGDESARGWYSLPQGTISGHGGGSRFYWEPNIEQVRVVEIIVHWSGSGSPPARVTLP